MSAFDHLAKVAIAAALGLSAALSQPAQAQDYPNRPIRILVGSAAGSIVDIWARRYAPYLGELMSQPVVVENRPGASGTLAAEALARSAPDGYTLLMSGANELAFAPATNPAVRYDAERDLQVVAIGMSGYGYLVARKDLGVRSIGELVSVARKRAGGLTCGTAGNASGQHLFCARVAQVTGLEIRSIHYKGSGLALADVASGQIDLAIGYAVELEPHVQAQRLTVLSRLGPTRSERFAQVETITEGGLDYVEAPGLLAIVGPKGIPADVAAKLNAAILRINQNKAIIDYATAAGSTIGAYDVTASAAFIRDVRQRAVTIVRESGIKADP